jgi:hypothetical protein
VGAPVERVAEPSKIPATRRGAGDWYMAPNALIRRGGGYSGIAPGLDGRVVTIRKTIVFDGYCVIEASLGCDPEGDVGRGPIRL